MFVMPPRKHATQCGRILMGRFYVCINHSLTFYLSHVIHVIWNINLHNIWFVQKIENISHSVRSCFQKCPLDSCIHSRCSRYYKNHLVDKDYLNMDLGYVLKSKRKLVNRNGNQILYTVRRFLEKMFSPLFHQFSCLCIIVYNQF